MKAGPITGKPTGIIQYWLGCHYQSHGKEQTMSRHIDAEAFMQDINDSIEEMTEIGIMVDGEYLWGKLLDALENAPSIDTDRPQGEWIDAEIPLESGGSMSIQVCNLCKTFYPLAYTGGGHRFCPNCGARMKGAETER